MKSGLLFWYNLTSKIGIGYYWALNGRHGLVNKNHVQPYALVQNGLLLYLAFSQYLKLASASRLFLIQLKEKYVGNM